MITKTLSSLAMCCILAYTFSCASSGSVSSIQEPLESDTPYMEQVEKHNRYTEVYDSLTTKFRLSATHLSYDFLAALNTRASKLYGTENTDFQNSDSKTGFFISIFSPDDQASDLSDSALWGITLETGTSKHYPIKVQKIYKKRKWKAFFPHVNKWTTEYFVLFDANSTSTLPEKLVAPQELKLTLSTTEAKIILSWP